MTASLYMEITSRCNLLCAHCYNESSTSGREMSYDEFKAIIEQSDFANTIILSGGEPLLHPQIYAFLEYLSTNSKANVNIVTNGILIDDQFVKWANAKLALDRFRFQISNDGNDAQTYEYIRGKGTFAAFQKALKISAKLKNEIYFHVTLCKANMHQIEEFVKTALSLNHKKIDFALIKPFGRTLANESLLPNINDLVLIRKCFDQIKKKYPDIKISSPEPFYGVCAFRIGKYDKLSIRVDPQLNVFPCQIMTLPMHCIGNLKDKSFDYILSHDNLRKLTMRLSSSENDNCTTCVAKMMCGRGCPATEMIDSGSKGIGCMYRIAFVKEQLLNSSNLSVTN